MKKVLFATAVLGLASAQAMAVSPTPFVQADLGLTHLQLDTDYLDGSANSFSQRVALGLDFEGDRLAFDISNYGSFSGEYGIKLKALGFALDYTHSFALDYAIRPYVGMTLGYGRYKLSGLGESETENHAIYTGKLGLEMDISRQTTLGFGLEYGALHNSKATAFTSGVFMRYHF